MNPGPGRAAVVATLRSHGWTLRDVGLMLDITPERVRQIAVAGEPKPVGRPRGSGHPTRTRRRPMQPLIVQKCSTLNDPSGNPRRAWAVYSVEPSEPVSVVERTGSVTATRAARQSYTRLAVLARAESDSLLWDVPELKDREFILMPERTLSPRDWKRMMKRRDDLSHGPV